MDKALYFLALIPPDPLERELYHLKEELSTRYQTFSALKSPSHITVLPPIRLGQEQRERALALLKAVTVGKPTFKVYLKDYHCFGEKTLYVGVQPNEELKQLYESVKEIMQEFIGETNLTHAFVPHLTLVNRDITPDQFKLAWNEFREKKFDAAFEARSLFMLELKEQRWEVVESFGIGY